VKHTAHIESEFPSGFPESTDLAKKYQPPKDSTSWIDYIPVTITSFLLLSQIIVGLYLAPEVSQIQVLAYAGAGLYACSGLIFGFLPVLEFRKKGGVRKGQSYVHTTRLVDTGIYSVVRHPQYVTFMMWAFAGMLLFQHWITVLLGVPILPLTYIDLIRADGDAVEKFGDDYRAYVKKVPRANFMLGLLRLIQRRRKQSQGSS
jgi:protein-S-isoprenylcysteine O-methyltransferase Ste14